MQNIIVRRYEHPESTGWAGWIEPEDKSWIVFVKNDHTVRVYLEHRVDVPSSPLSSLLLPGRMTGRTAWPDGRARALAG